jgi:hypothetical protein
MDDGSKKKFNAKTMRDENGHYPEWMSKKDRHRRQTKHRRSKKAVKRGQSGKKGKKAT